MTLNKKKIIALIPARSGSERIKNKNIIDFLGKPLIFYAINSAIKSSIFNKIVVSTDSSKYAKIAKKYGAEVPFLRPKKISKSSSSDYEWVKFTLDQLAKKKQFFSHFFILRPTSPLRTEKTILRAWQVFNNVKTDSLRAVEEVKQNPGKMWLVKNNFLKPLLNYKVNNQPSYNNQFKVLKKTFVQNASLEISSVDVLKKYKTITGKRIVPFYTKGIEGFDINYPSDIKLIKLEMNKKKF